MQMHFISGLPRSGSTLLASVLRQNPEFSASIMSPVGRIFTDVVTAMGSSNEADSFITNAHRERVARALFSSFYADKFEEGVKVVFDNNRRWCANAALLDVIYPDSKIICCVRSPAAIVDSFERLFRANPFALSVIYGGVSNLTVYERTMTELPRPR